MSQGGCSQLRVGRGRCTPGDVGQYRGVTLSQARGADNILTRTAQPLKAKNYPVQNAQEEKPTLDQRFCLPHFLSLFTEDSVEEVLPREALLRGLLVSF